jgi:Tol biopolymer transport system component
MRQLVWADRNGNELARLGEAVTGVQLSPSLSADGSRVAMYRRVDGNLDGWVGDTTRGLQSRLTTDPADESVPIWSPDGNRIAFASNRPNGPGLYVKSLARRSEAEILLPSRMGAGGFNAASPAGIRVTDWSSDGGLLVGYRGNGPTAEDIWALPLDPSAKPFPLVQTKLDDRWPQFSPDGKWIAYESNESGRFEIYVLMIDGSGEPVRVSINGGVHARWRHDGRELFYIALDDQLMAVPIRLGAARGKVDVGTPAPLFITRIGSVLHRNPTQGPQYAVAPDGRRFLMNTLVEGTTSSPITLILNWKGNPSTRSPK